MTSGTQRFQKRFQYGPVSEDWVQTPVGEEGVTLVGEATAFSTWKLKEMGLKLQRDWRLPQIKAAYLIRYLKRKQKTEGS